MASVLGHARAASAPPHGLEKAAHRRDWLAARWIGGAVIALQAARGGSGWLNRRLVPSSPSGVLVGDIAGEIGRGLIAGLVGTVAITLAAAADQQVRSWRKPSPVKGKAPTGIFPILMGPWLYSADALAQVLGGVTPADDTAKRRLALAAHLSYGGAWGVGFAGLWRAGVRGPVAMMTLLGGILGAEMLVMPRVGFFPPVSQWGREAVISSSYQHALYAIAAGLTFDWLQR